MQKYTLDAIDFSFEICLLRYSEGKQKKTYVILLAFHEFLSKSFHIYRLSSLGDEVFLGTQKFRFLTHKLNILGKW